MVECEELKHPFHTCPATGRPVKCTGFNTDGCIRCVQRSKDGEIEHLKEKLAEKDKAIQVATDFMNTKGLASEFLLYVAMNAEKE